MLRVVIVMAALAASSAASAADSCAVQAVRLIAQGKTNELSAKFKKPSPEITQGIERLAGDLGRIDDVAALAHQTAGKSVRKSFASGELPSTYSFEGSWAVATTQKAGRVEFQASAEPGSECKLLALHVHSPL